MDGPTLDHSDSDSGDSWTLLEHSPAYGNDAPGFAENMPLLERDTADSNMDKDEDTDGISIISDSESESSTPCDLLQEKCILEESCPIEQPSSQYISFSPLPPNSNDHEESIRSEDDFLGDNTGKHKTYVHRRNKRLSTVLNIIMLGSVITAAGVAIGHMWGARNECSVHTTPSINKVLSNLYKLQEENTYLRNKLKELSLVNTHMLQKKSNTADKLPFKQQRCKKIFEEPLNSKNTKRITKCIETEFIDTVDKNLNNHLIQPEYEKEFARDVEKLKLIYQQNRSWLDDEVTKRIQHETMKRTIKSPLSSITEEQKILQDENIKSHTGIDSNPFVMNISPDAEQINQSELDPKTKNIDKPVLTVKKISYADSLKSDQLRKVQKREINITVEKDRKDKLVKKKIKKDKDVTFYEINFSEEELKKDDRYIGHRQKQDKKKRDRQKLHKKQKRRNKYEQWEMKGGYMKDYDDFSTTSFQENTGFKKPDGNQVSREFEKTIYINQFSETDSKENIVINTKPKEVQNKKLEKSSGKNKAENNWFDKRAALRAEARKQLEYELFGESSPNNAGWYFRRMQKREQCRAKSDNSTYKKLSKRNMNFKTKH